MCARFPSSSRGAYNRDALISWCVSVIFFKFLALWVGTLTCAGTRCA
jgi:hypothetical protein